MKTLLEHLKGLFDAKTEDLDPALRGLDAFLRFAEGEMGRNPPIGVAFSGEGLSLNLQDRTLVLVSPSARVPERPGHVYAVTSHQGDGKMQPDYPSLPIGIDGRRNY